MSEILYPTKFVIEPKILTSLEKELHNLWAKRLKSTARSKDTRNRIAGSLF